MTQQELERAIAALESNRAVLDEAIVDTAVAALRVRLDALIDMDASQRHLTVLMADLSGFTAMSEVLDAEQVRDRIDAIWQRLDTVIQSWGGVIDKHVGDGVIALFGLFADEDADLRAVLAALDMQMELQVLQMETRVSTGESAPPLSMSMRVGVHAGPVYWGQLGSSNQHTAVGDTVTAAEQLESSAPLGGTIISHPVYRQVRERFQVAPAPELPADMPDFPAYLVKQEIWSGFGGDALASSSRTRLVGRDDTLMALQQAIQASLDGGFGQLVQVDGVMGSGKTRLIYELHRLLQLGPGVETWYASVPPALPHLDAALFRDLVSRRFRIRRWQQAAAARHKLALGLARCGLTGDVAQMDALYRLLSFAEEEDSSSIEDRFAALASLLTAVARKQPTMLVLDDLHRADAQSLALINHLAAATQDVPLVLVALTRPELARRNPDWLQAPWPPVEVKAEALSSIATRHLLNELLEMTSHVPLPAADVLVAVTQGNPLFIMELIPYLINRGVIEPDKSGVRLRLGKLQTLSIPSTLRGLFWERFNRLPEAARDLLQQAAAAGLVFWERMLPAGDDVPALLQELQRQGVVRQRQSSYVAGSREYGFTHELWRQIAYDSLDVAARSTAHIHVANWLETVPHNGVPQRPLLIAHHHKLAEQTR